MDDNRLLSDELSYELMVRNLSFENTVANKRKYTQTSKIRSSKNLFCGSRVEYKRLHSRLLHVYERLKIIVITSEIHQGLVTDQIVRCLFLLGQLNEVNVREVNFNKSVHQEILNQLIEILGSVIDDPNQFLPEIVHSNSIINQPDIESVNKENFIEGLLETGALNQRKRQG